MKWRYKAFSVLIICLVGCWLTFVTSTAFGQGTSVDPGSGPLDIDPIGDSEEPPEVGRSFYGWKGHKTRLYVVPEKIGITFKEKVSAEGLRSFLDSEQYVEPMAADVVSQESDLGYTRVVQTVSGITVSDVRNVIEIVRARDEVESANPVFRLATDQESLLTDMFYVSFPIDTLERDITALFDADRLEILSCSEFSRIGKVGYRVRVTKTARNASGEDAVAMANRYYEHPLTIEATPSFAPLYRTFLSGPVPDGLPDDEYYDCDVETDENQWNLWPTLVEDNYPMLNGPLAWETVYGSDWDMETPEDLKAAFPEVIIACGDNGITLDYGHKDNGRTVEIDGEEYNIPKPGDEKDPNDPNSEGLYYLGDDVADLRGHIDLNPNQWYNVNEIINDQQGAGRG